MNTRDRLTLIRSAAVILTTFARRSRKVALMRRARHVGESLLAAFDALDGENGEIVAVAFCDAAERMLRQIEDELWADPAERPHWEDVAEQLDRHGITVAAVQIHNLKAYFA